MTLETFGAPQFSGSAVLTFNTDELTALCPFDFGGPDYYDLTIRYEPDGICVESRSLKEYLETFREEGITAERLAADLHKTVEDHADPARLYVRIEQARRGGLEETVEVGDRGLRE